MKVAVIGSRSFENIDISKIKEKLPEECSCIVSGGAAGVDRAAERLAKKYGFAFEKYEPDYEKFGKKAPILRNIEIVENSDIVLAFWDFKSRGTSHAIVQCVKKHVPFRIFGINE